MNPLIRSSFSLLRIVRLLTAVFVTVVSAHAQTLTKMHTFEGHGDGLNPLGGVIQDQFGNLYGTTAQGGTGTQGTVFKVDKIDISGYTVLHSFVARPDGLEPQAGLVIDNFGNLYGTTENGGSSGKGTIFKIDTSGNETVLRNFCCDLGKNPVSGLIFDGSGNLYGTAQTGGEDGQNGTVFKLSPSRTLTVLHDFNRKTGDGSNPRGTLFLDPSGNLFGTTYQGGTHNQGIVFKIDNAGNYTVVYSFGLVGGEADGKWLLAGVIMDHSGNLLGTTNRGGAFKGGTVFKIDANGQKTLLHNFGATLDDGRWPSGELAIDANGNIYGTTLSGGGLEHRGTVFKIDNAGNYSVLHSFKGIEGDFPVGRVIVGADGNLYGTCSQGGSQSNGTGGTVWQLSLH
jgi:uncharacterized repeat protein (TIGR03803 family)